MDPLIYWKPSHRGRINDERYMRIAIEEAKKALQDGEGLAFGAVIVKDNKILSSSHNTVYRDNDPTSHAEINAIRIACKSLDSKDLSDSTLYSTCEPCPMCFTASWWADISRLVYGAELSDIIRLGGREIEVGAQLLNERGGSKIEIVAGLLKDECLKLYERKTS